MKNTESWTIHYAFSDGGKIVVVFLGDNKW